MRRFVILFVVMLSVLTATAQAAAADSAFNYQGKLTDSAGAPFTGSVDLTFKLFDAETDGNQVGSDISVTGVAVDGGLFTVDLDFGSTAFDGSACWLETTVGTQVLTPRVKLNAVPHAVYAQTVPWGGVTGAPTIPTTLPPIGAAGGDLAGTYPNPTLAPDSVTSAKLADDQNSLNKITGGTLTVAGLSLGVNNASPTEALDVRGTIDVVDQEQTQVYGGDTGSSIWQSFTAGMSGDLVAVAADVEANNNQNEWNGTLRIYSGQGTSGTLLLSQSVVGPAGSHRFPTFRLTTPVPVTAGQQYTIRLSGDYMFWYGDTRNPYDGGRSDYGAVLDLTFKTFVSTTKASALVVQHGTLNVGIGTSDPTAKLHVLGGDICLKTPDNTLDQSLLFQNAGRAYTWRIYRTDAGSNEADLRIAGGGTDSDFTALSDVLTLTNTGNVGIGTNSPNYKLHVNGSVAGVGAYNQLSDIRYKTNIREIPDALDKVEALRGVTFDWKQSEYPDINFDNAKQAGVIAQEVQKVLPEAVSRDSDGNLSVSYATLVPLLIQGMKEQQKQIDELKKLVETLAEK